MRINGVVLIAAVSLAVVIAYDKYGKGGGGGIRRGV